MEHLFIPYELALKLKEKGFDEPCWAWYNIPDKDMRYCYSEGRSPFSNYTEVLVIDAELVLVRCDITQSLIYRHTNGSWGLSKEGVYFHMSEALYYKPIYISRTEKVLEGDWVWSKNSIAPLHIDGKINTVEMLLENHWYKILALPEHFSPEHLQMIVDGKLKEGDKVLVKCEMFEPYSQRGQLPKIPIIKLNPHITIYPVEEKMYTLQEISEQFIGEGKKGGYFDDYLDYVILNDPKPRPTFKEWFEQNVK